jgi:hypothetical protein
MAAASRMESDGSEQAEYAGEWEFQSQIHKTPSAEAGVEAKHEARYRR